MSYQYNSADQSGQYSQNYASWASYNNYYTYNVAQQQSYYYPNNAYAYTTVEGSSAAGRAGNSYDAVVTAEATNIVKTVNGRSRSPVQRILRCRLDDSDGVREYAEISNKRSYLRPRKVLPRANSSGGHSGYSTTNNSPNNALVNSRVDNSNNNFPRIQSNAFPSSTQDNLARIHGIVAQGRGTAQTASTNRFNIANTLGIVAQAPTTVPQRQLQTTIPLADQRIKQAEAEEKRKNDLMMNEAIFLDRIMDTEFRSSWYKLKKKEYEGREVICVVVEIIDGEKVCKVYGGYTDPDRAKELAFKAALKKLTIIEEEKARLKYNATVTNDDQSVTEITECNDDDPNTNLLMLSNVPLLLPNPLSAVFSGNANTELETYSPQFQEYEGHNRTAPLRNCAQPEPPGTEIIEKEYDPVDYHYSIDKRPNPQPHPPGTENDHFYGRSNRQEVHGQRYGQSQFKDNLGYNEYETAPAPTVDRPSLGRGENESKFLETIKSVNYRHQCVQLPSKLFGNTEYFGFEIELWKISEPSTRLKITGSFKRDDFHARESVYAMSLAKLEKMAIKKFPSRNNYSWLSKVPNESSTGISDECADPEYEPLRKIHLRPEWSWKSTSDDLSILSSLPKSPMTYSIGRGRGIPRQRRSPSPPGGGILDHRDWRWPAV